MKFIFKQAIQWIIAFAIGFLIVNILCFAYERPVGWHDSEHGAAKAVRNPGSVMIHSTEGFAISEMDDNGFPNSSANLGESYILISGASHTVGKEICSSKRYSEIVNDYFAKDSTSRAAYNIACDAHYLPTQIKHFKAAVSAYKNASHFVIEITSTDFSPEEIKEAMNQPDYDEGDSGVYFKNMTTAEKLKVMIKEDVPMLSMIKSQMETGKAAADKESGGDDNGIDEAEYGRVINDALSLMRSETDKPVVFVYHPETTIKSDGTISVNYSKTWELFKEACKNNNIDVIDSGDDFLENYRENKTLPYGFSNTTLGYGHLNAVGHSIVADEIIEYILEDMER